MSSFPSSSLISAARGIPLIATPTIESASICRFSSSSRAMSDIALEELEKRQMDADSIVGVAINGIPLAALISEELGKELIVYRPSEERHGTGGAFSANYASPQGQKVLIVDDVVSTGDTVKAP